MLALAAPFCVTRGTADFLFTSVSDFQKAASLLKNATDYVNQKAFNATTTWAPVLHAHTHSPHSLASTVPAPIYCPPQNLWYTCVHHLLHPCSRPPVHSHSPPPSCPHTPLHSTTPSLLYPHTPLHPHSPTPSHLHPHTPTPSHSPSISPNPHTPLTLPYTLTHTFTFPYTLTLTPSHSPSYSLTPRSFLQFVQS